ncbi:hypothetical protein H6F43_03280 [Leptolyngbya sp. FACHB-36]|uniref:hypothetical protein n=1 Tax=Leptolyngbya sp. FACHB-36 TaxID=2692808 RepID=UPI001681705D|nr:hypothetical protein [Leptolyngbya sp. FACHB-36]MBD2019206.1 hypothetical protein [Leptolyngbya sp. FACHB-36]
MKRNQTIGCRVSDDELSQVDSIIQETGQSRAEWLYALVYRELHGTSPNTVRGLLDRVEAIELRLARLAR